MHRYCALFLLFILLSSCAANAVRNCEKSHCADFGGDVSGLCEFERKAKGDYVNVVIPRSGICKCACSCLTQDAKVLMFDLSFKRVDEIQQGDSLFSPFVQGNKVTVERVFVSQVEEYPTIILQFEDNLIESSPNHVFVGENGQVRRADSLGFGDVVKDSNGSDRRILGVAKGNYTGGLYNLGLRGADSGARAHIFVANNCQSGDQYLQNFENINKSNGTVYETEIH